MKKTIKILFIIIILIIVSLFLYFFDIKSKKNNQSNTYAEQEVNSKIKIIAVGDSLTAGYGLPLAESYPTQLEKKLQENNYNVEVINAGISGETTAGLLERVDFIKENKPDILLITIGGNDALRNLPINETEKNIKTIVQDFKQVIPAQNIFLMQIKSPLNRGLSYAQKFNEIYPNLAKTENVTLVPFVENKVFLNKSFMLDDGIHPNKAGYEFLINEYIYQAVEKAVKQL